MNDEQLNRYSRQIMLPEFDYQGQQDLLNARVLIIGLGGLGSPVALYLAAAGVGTLVLADGDIVDYSNLQRQIIHGEANVGQTKVSSAQQSIVAINSGVEVVTLMQRLEAEALSEQIEMADVVVDCCDNLDTRLAVNKVCLEQGTPLVSGAAIRMEGQIIVVDPRHKDMPCYHCLMKFTGPQDRRCSTNGVMAPLVGIVGAVQAMEAIKVIAKVGEPLLGKLLLLDAKAMKWQQFELPKDTTCPTCRSE